MTQIRVKQSVSIRGQSDVLLRRFSPVFIKETLPLFISCIVWNFSHSPLSHLPFIYGAFNLNTAPFAFYRAVGMVRVGRRFICQFCSCSYEFD